MSPVVRLAKLPEVQTGCKQWPIHAGRELLTARIQRIHTGRFRRRLNDPAFGLASIRRTRPHKQSPVITESASSNHHVAVLAAPATAEVIDITAFTLHAATAAAIENLTFATDFSDKLHPGFLLCDADIQVITVTKNVDIKVFGIPVAFTDSHVARRPAKTRFTSSLQIGMINAVRCSGFNGSSPTVDADILYLSRPISSCRKPINAVQNPADTQQNSTAKRIRIPVCSI